MELTHSYRYHSALMIEAQQRLVLYYMDALMRKYVLLYRLCGYCVITTVINRRMVFKNEKERQKGAEQIKKEAKHISSFFARLSHATNPKVL